MLYDQATLARAYLHAWLVAGGERHRRVVEETIDYVLRELRHAAGGFYSAEDADSEGEEGLFYVWSLDELTEVVSGAGLTEADAAAALGRADWMEAARANARFLLAELRRADTGGSRRPGRGDTPQPPGGRLLRSWQADAPPAPDGSRARHLGYAEDYAALLG